MTNLEELTYDELLAKAQAAEAAKAELESKYRKMEGAKNHYKSKLTKVKDGLEDKPIKQEESSQPDDAWKAKLELKVEGYSDEEVKFILKNGGKKAINDPFVKNAIESIRQQAKAESAVPKSGSGGDVISNVPMEQIKAMSASELEKKIQSGEIKQS